MGIAPLQIGQVAQKTGLSVDAIRFYERSGQLPRTARTQSGYRLYEEREIADLEFIQKAQQLGFRSTKSSKCPSLSVPAASRKTPLIETLHTSRSSPLPVSLRARVTEAPDKKRGQKAGRCHPPS